MRSADQPCPACRLPDEVRARLVPHWRRVLSTTLTYTDESSSTTLLHPRVPGVAHSLVLAIAKGADGIWRASVVRRFDLREIGVYMGPHYGTVEQDALEGAALWIWRSEPRHFACPLCLDEHTINAAEAHTHALAVQVAAQIMETTP